MSHLLRLTVITLLLKLQCISSLAVDTAENDKLIAMFEPSSHLYDTITSINNSLHAQYKDQRGQLSRPYSRPNAPKDSNGSVNSTTVSWTVWAVWSCMQLFLLLFLMGKCCALTMLQWLWDYLVISCLYQQSTAKIRPPPPIGPPPGYVKNVAQSINLLNNEKKE